MFSVTIHLFLLSLAPALTFGEKCGLCTGFDDSLPIDLSSLKRMMDDNPNRFGESTDDMLPPSSCEAIKTKISSLDFESDSPQCALYSAVAYGSCGCTDDPPTDSCYACPFGGTFKKDTMPDLPNYGGEGWGRHPNDATCGEIAFTLSFLSASIDLFSAGWGDIDYCGIIRSPCGCDPNPDTCKICEYGVENPYHIINYDDNAREQLTCGQVFALFTVELGGHSQSECDKFKSYYDDDEVCVCSSPSLSPSLSPSPSTSPNTSQGSASTKDLAAAYKNIVTLLVISAITTMVAFLG